MDLCSHHCQQVSSYFCHPENSPMPASGLASFHAEPQETASLLSVSTDSPAPDISRNGIAQCVSFTSGLVQAVWRFWSLCVVACQDFFPVPRWAVFHHVDSPQPAHTFCSVLSYSLMAFLSSTCLLTSLPALPMEHGLPRDPGQSGLPGFGPWGCNLGTLHSIPPPFHLWLQIPVPGSGSEPSYITWRSYDHYIELIGRGFWSQEALQILKCPVRNRDGVEELRVGTMSSAQECYV